jgi:hypothetical protein
MALTPRQRNALPDSAFALPSQRKYPMPTKAQAAKAGISERQRLGAIRNALARGAQSGTAGNYRRMAKVARARAGEKVATTSRSKGSVTQPGKRRRR